MNIGRIVTRGIAGKVGAVTLAISSLVGGIFCATFSGHGHKDGEECVVESIVHDIIDDVVEEICDRADPNSSRRPLNS